MAQSVENKMAPPETRSVGTNQQTIVQVNTNIKQPDGMVMEGCLADNWKFFQQKFNLFLKASRSTGESTEFKTSLLLSSIGDKSLKIYNNLAFEATEDKEDYETVINKFDGYFNPEKNVTYERHMFLSRDKKPHEKVNEYITDLRELSTTCEFGTLTDSLITSKLILGLKNDPELQNQLIRTKNITLVKAKEMCRLAERTKIQIEKITKTEEAEICKVKKLTKKTNPANGSDGKVSSNNTGPSVNSGTHRSFSRSEKSARVQTPEFKKLFNCYKCGVSP